MAKLTGDEIIENFEKFLQDYIEENQITINLFLEPDDIKKADKPIKDYQRINDVELQKIYKEYPGLSTKYKKKLKSLITEYQAQLVIIK